MIFQVGRHGWPIGQYLIPPSTIIDWSSSDQWSQLAKANGGIPLDAGPQDDEAKAALAAEQKRVGYRYP